MILKGALSLSRQEEGRRNYNRFNFMNGLSYICLGETIIILFAVKLGSPDYCIAILASFLYLSNFCMPFGKMLAARMGAAKSISLCWAMRNFSALLVASAPLWGWLIGPAAAIAVIMLGAFIFYSCRSAGVVGMQPLMGEITSAENRGRFTSKSYGLFNLANLLMLSLIILLFNYSRDTWVFVSVIVTGAGFGLASTFFLSRIDESEAIIASAKKPVRDDVLLTLKNPARLKQLGANFAINAAIILTIPISMLALKKGYGISDNNALLFALVQFAGGVATSHVMGLLAEVTGPRPLAVLFYSSLMALCLLWGFGPDSFVWYYTIWPFILAGAAAMGTGVAMTQYFLVSIPNKERVAASLTIYVASGVFAGLTGSLLGGGLLKWLGTLGYSPIGMFKVYFLIVLVILVAGIALVSRLESLTDWKVREVLGLAFAPKDIITLYNLYSINQVADPDEEKESIERLLETRSELSEKALLSYLDSPKFHLRGRALSALGEIPFGERTVKALLEELEDGEHTTAHIAAQIAGERKVKEAIPLLRRHLDSADYYLQGKTMLALALLKDKESYPRIERLFRESPNPRIVMHGAAALVEIGDDDSFKLLLAKSLQPELPEKALYELLYSAAELAGQGDEIYKFLKLYCKDRVKALQHLSELCAKLQPHGPQRTFNTIVFDFERGVVSKEEMLKSLKGGMASSTNPKAPLIRGFLDSLDPAEAPPELLLCLLPLTR